MVNQTLVLGINPDRYRDGKIANFAKLQNVMGKLITTVQQLNRQPKK